jgi:uncharacterized protein (TIGR02466 family)
MIDLKVLYALPLGIFDASEFVEEAKSLFNGQIKLKSSKSVNHKTTLGNYLGSSPELVSLPNSKPLKQFICECAKEFSTAIGYATEHYEPSVKNIWLNEMTSGATHELHNHYGSNFSGCFYVQVPENSGFITFETLLSRYDRAPLEVKEYKVFNSSEWNATVKQGELFLWESFVKHQVKPTAYKGKRLSIAFDVVMNLKENT